MSKRIISLFLCVVMCFSFFTLSVSASSPLQTVHMMGSYMDLLYSMGAAGRDVAALIGGVFLEEDVCPYAPTDSNKRHKIIQQPTTLDGQAGLFYLCEYCGMDVDEEMSSFYDNHVNDLHSTYGSSSFGSDGAIYIPLSPGTTGNHYVLGLCNDMHFLDAVFTYERWRVSYGYP